MASGNGFGGRKNKPYRKHRPLPALIVVAILGIGAVFVWTNVVMSKKSTDEAVRCEPAASPPPGVNYTSLGHDGLNDVSPIPPDKIAVQVLNAGGARGQASITTQSVRLLGFSQIGEPENDPAYAKTEAECRGQIRFGENGMTAARTVSLVVPCAELVKDNRQDASVDLSIGKRFGDVRPTTQAKEILDQLSAWSAQHQGTGGDEQATGGQVPPVDQTKLASARETSC